MLYKDQTLSLGTGFFYELDGNSYLITNWHNVAGRHPQTQKLLSSSGGLPDRVRLTVSKEGILGQWFEHELPLYTDANTHTQPAKPIWLVHPTSEEKIDAVAIPFKAPKGGDLNLVNTIHSTPNMQISVSDDVFILGYPKGITGGGSFPIWKRASIATEPGLDLNSLPYMLVDTATRKGMSGAPVIAKRSGGYSEEGGGMIIGTDGSKFIGVYSGRLGVGEMQAQLGVVWKVSAIDEIIRGKKIGKSSFSLNS